MSQEKRGGSSHEHFCLTHYDKHLSCDIIKLASVKFYLINVIL